VEQQRAMLTAAHVAFANAGPNFERNRAQFAAAFISAQVFDEAKASYDAAQANLYVATRALAVAEASLAVTQRNLDDTVVRAPFAGIGTIVDMDSLEVEVDVSESFISRVETDQPVVITLNAYPDRRIPGRVVA